MRTTLHFAVVALLCQMTVLSASAAEANYGDGAKKSLTTVVVNDEGEKLLADSTGRTLYTFDLDKGKPTSACNADCAEVWPPVLVSAAEVKNLKAPFGSLERANKKLQLTYNNQLVYIYAFDRGQADDAGDGVGGVWHYIEMEH